MEKRVEQLGCDVTFNSPGDGDCFYASAAKALGIETQRKLVALQKVEHHLLQALGFQFPKPLPPRHKINRRLQAD